MSLNSSLGPDRPGHNERKKPDGNRPTRLRGILVVLTIEKIIQHVVVTAAFYFDWRAIASTVAVDATALMIIGALLALLFVVAFWGLVGRRRWVAGLLIGLALCDILGEFVAQGTVIIAVTVSFVVATVLLIVALLYRTRSGSVVQKGLPVDG
jgi:hypothetical protein